MGVRVGHNMEERIDYPSSMVTTCRSGRKTFVTRTTLRVNSTKLWGNVAYNGERKGEGGLDTVLKLLLRAPGFGALGYRYGDLDP